MSIFLSAGDGFRCRIQRYPSAQNIITAPTPAPTPIPAMAPVDRLESVAAAVAVAVVDVGEDVDEDEDEDTEARASTGAMVTAEEVPQQPSLSPQHHSVELSVPSQDVSCVVDPAVYIVSSQPVQSSPVHMPRYIQIQSCKHRHSSPPATRASNRDPASTR